MSTWNVIDCNLSEEKFEEQTFKKQIDSPVISGKKIQKK